MKTPSPRRGRQAFAGLLLAAISLASWAAEAERPTLRERIEQRRAERAADKSAAPVAGSLQELQVSHGGQRRKVLLRLPAGFKPGQPLPLVLAFHGGGGHAEHMADDANYGLQRQADASGYAVAFPNGYSKLPGGRFATWNASGCCGDARDKQIDDVGFARAVVAAVQARVDIDSARVFAIGMSNGGMMVHRLACEAADVFRAVASVTGTDATSTCQPGRPISVLHIHAKDDTHVLFNGGAGEDAFRDKSKVMDFVSVPETVQRWTQRNRCTAAPQRVLEGPGAYCDLTPGCADGVSVQLCVTEEGGHSWPGADKTRRGKPGPSRALDANAQIWAFFEKQR